MYGRAFRVLTSFSSALCCDDPAHTVHRGAVLMPRVNLGTCCGSDPSVGLQPWLDVGGVGIDTAWVRPPPIRPRIPAPSLSLLLLRLRSLV
jgi:hypothetical protein